MGVWICWYITFFFQFYPAKSRNFNLVSLALDNHFCICFHKVHFHIRFFFFLEIWKSMAAPWGCVAKWHGNKVAILSEMIFKKIFKRPFCIHNALFYRFTAYLFYPCIFWMLFQVYIVQPLWKFYARYKTFFLFIHFFVISQKKIIHKTTGAYGSLNDMFLFFGWV